MSNWIERGCPVVERADRNAGRDWKLRLADIFDWRIKTSVDDAVATFRTDEGHVSKEEADRRKALAQARLAEIEVDEKLRAVVAVADAEEAMSDFCHALRSGLSNGAVKSAGRTAGMTDPHEIREFFESEINKSMKAARAMLHEKWTEVRDGEPAAPDSADEVNDDKD